MTTHSVSNGSELSAALDGAIDGDLILCASGSYGTVRISSKTFGSDLTIRSATPRGARFNGLTLTACRRIVLDGIHVSQNANAPVVTFDGSPDCQFVNGEIDGITLGGNGSSNRGFYALNGSHGFTLANSVVRNVFKIAHLNAVNGWAVRDSSFFDVDEDALTFSSCSDGTISGNMFPDTYHLKGADPHPDTIQSLGTNHRITISGNVQLACNSQGFVLVGSGDNVQMHDCVVANNLIVSNYGHAIKMDAPGNTGNVVIDNTLIHKPDGGQPVAHVSVTSGTVTARNVVMVNNSGHPLYGQYGIDSIGLVPAPSGDANFIGRYYSNGDAIANAGSKVVPLPVEGVATHWDFGGTRIGAWALLKELLEPSELPPSPEPEPEPAPPSGPPALPRDGKLTLSLDVAT